MKVFKPRAQFLRRNKQGIRRNLWNQSISEVFWSEMGDSNSRPDGPKAGALPTALHPDMKLWGGPGVFSQKRFSAFFIVVYSNLSSFLLQPSYFLAILFPLFPCIPALSVVLHVVSGKVSARIPAPQWHPRWYNLPQSLKNGTSISKNIQDFFERKPINYCVAISKKTSVKNSPQKSAVVSEATADFLECSIATGARIL